MQSGAILSLVRGDDQSITVTVTNLDGSVYDLTGCSLIFTVRRDTYFSAIILTKTVTSHSNPTGGISSFDFVPADTSGMDDAPFYFDVKLIDSQSKVKTLMSGTLTIAPF